MKKSIISAVLTIFIGTAMAQNKHKIVFDLSSSDTAVHSTLLRQLNNILTVAPEAQLEVVFHGKAVYVMVKSTVVFEEKLNELKSRGVMYKVCENSMKRFNVNKSELIPIAETVPVAMMEFSGKQMEGWSYIKSGQ